MDRRRNLLWVDGSAGAVVGCLMLLASGWLSELYHLPRDLLIFMGLANLVYGSYSLSLAFRSRRPMALILLLVAANLIWALACLRWAVLYGDVASPFGLVQLLGEALFVGGLGYLEWRWRKLLLSA